MKPGWCCCWWFLQWYVSRLVSYLRSLLKISIIWWSIHELFELSFLRYFHLNKPAWNVSISMVDSSITLAKRFYKKSPNISKKRRFARRQLCHQKPTICVCKKLCVCKYCVSQAAFALCAPKTIWWASQCCIVPVASTLIRLLQKWYSQDSDYNFDFYYICFLIII